MSDVDNSEAFQDFSWDIKKGRWGAEMEKGTPLLSVLAVASLPPL